MPVIKGLGGTFFSHFSESTLPLALINLEKMIDPERTWRAVVRYL